jgi:hypothetical protein
MGQKLSDASLLKSFTSGFCKFSTLTILFGALFGGCARQPVNAAEHSAATAPGATVALIPSRLVAKPLSMGELVRLAGDPCETELKGSRCMSEESDFALIPDCAAAGYYAVVDNSLGTALLSKVPPKNNVVRATISRGQLVCVQAIARIKAYPSYLFVTAISNTGTKACSECNGYGSQRIDWKISHEDGPCIQTAPGRFEGGCAIGWVDADDLKLLGNAK